MALAFISGYNASPKTSLSRRTKILSSESVSGVLRFVDLGAQNYWDIKPVYEALTETEKDTLTDWLETNESTEIALTIGTKTYNGYINPRSGISASPFTPMLWNVSFGFVGVKQ